MYYFIFPPTVYEDSSFSMSSLTLYLIYSCYPNGYDVVYHCGFDLHFPNHIPSDIDHLLFIHFISASHDLWDLSSPTRYWTCALSSEKCGVLTTGPPGNSMSIFSCAYWPFVYYLWRSVYSSSGFILKILFIFNWRVMALKYCVCFCHISTWISHRYTAVHF